MEEGFRTDIIMVGRCGDLGNTAAVQFPLITGSMSTAGAAGHGCALRCFSLIFYALSKEVTDIHAFQIGMEFRIYRSHSLPACSCNAS